jgi:hypothetical protein
MPGTVSLLGSKCWVFRIDYSTHHWQTWKYCLHDSGLWEAGGQSWQLWSVGPLQFTNLSSFSCAPASMTLPADASPGERWESRCTGVNTSVKGRTMSAGPYRFVGLATMSIGGTRVEAAHFSRFRVDSGAQRGTERSAEWFDARSGLPLRLDQDIKVTTSTVVAHFESPRHRVARRLVGVAKRARMPSDANQRARATVELATGQRAADNPKPITLGQISGKKGGETRAKRLTPEERSEIARRAAEARWKRTKSSG